MTPIGPDPADDTAGGSASDRATTSVRASLPTSTTPPLRDLWRHAAGHRGRVVFSVIMSVLNKACDVAPEILIGAAVDVVVNDGRSMVGRILGTDDRFQQLYVLAAVTVVVWIAESVTQYIAHVSWRNLAQTIEHETRMEAYRHVQSLELAAFDDTSSGGLLTVLNDDVNQLERFLDVGADEIVVTTANVVFIGAVFAIISPQLTVLAFLPIPVIIGGSLLFQKRLRPHYDAVRAATTRIADTLTNSLGGMATVKAFSGEAREVSRIETESQHYRQVNRRAIGLSSAFVPLIRMAILAGFTVTLVVGGRAVLRGEMAVGSFSVLVYMTQRLLWPMTRLGEVLDLYQRAMASCRRIFGLLELEPSIVEGAEVLPHPVRGEVSFEHVSFRYRDDPGSPLVLDDVSLHIPAGETHAIVGPTGAGKSTVVKLLLRLYEPQSGCILLDGHDVGSLKFSSLRGATGFVSQDVFLFHGTVRENLTYGSESADDARLWAAAEAAEAADFIRALPHGLDSVVGERGQKLSGGQRQRLTIARALVRDPAILLLDEATSAIDNETEAAIQRSLRTASEGRTSLVIAHRLSTIRHAHRIHVLEAGKIVESGTHDDLVAEGGLYAALWRVQTGEA